MTEDQQKFLNDLRASGIVNMIGAMPYLRDEFYLTQVEALEILREWMETFRSQTSADICGND